MSEAENGPGPDKQPARTDPAVPPPAGLSTYLQLLGEWARGRPLSEAFLVGLLQTKNYGELERAEFLAGADGLWSFVPPITAPDVAEADLRPESARALSLALELRGWHALHHHLPLPGELPADLREVAEMASVIQLLLDGHERPETRAERRLKRLVEALGERGARAGKLADRKEDVRGALTQRRAAEEAQRLASEQDPDAETPGNSHATPRTRTAVSLRSVVFIVASLTLSPFLYLSVRVPPSGGLPPASAYVEVPVLGLIRHPDSIAVRVDAAWLLVAPGERATGARRLWDRLSKESGGALRALLLQTRSGTELAVVTAGGVRWLGPLAAATPTPTPAAPQESTAVDASGAPEVETPEVEAPHDPEAPPVEPPE